MAIFFAALIDRIAITENRPSSVGIGTDDTCRRSWAVDRRCYDEGHLWLPSFLIRLAPLLILRLWRTGSPVPEPQWWRRGVSAMGCGRSAMCASGRSRPPLRSMLLSLGRLERTAWLYRKQGIVDRHPELNRPTNEPPARHASPSRATSADQRRGDCHSSRFV